MNDNFPPRTVLHPPPTEIAPNDPMAENLWMLEVLRDLYRYARRAGLPDVADHLLAASEALLADIRDQALRPGRGPAGA